MNERFVLYFGLGWKPCPDMDIEGKQVVDVGIIRTYAESHRAMLHEAAHDLELLLEKGWTAWGMLYHIECQKDCTRNEAESDLKDADLSKLIERLDVMELDEDEEYLDEEE